MAPPLRELRLQRRISQQALAQAAGISRQALHAIERGAAMPRVDVALRLAAVLGASVEQLFAPPLPQPLRVAVPTDAAPGTRLRLAVVAGRPVGIPLSGEWAWSVGLAEADARAGMPAEGGRVALRELLSLPVEGPAARRLVVAGCDPALGLAATLVHRSQPQTEAAVLAAGSRHALELLRDGFVHVAGVHWSASVPEGPGSSGDPLAAALAFIGSVTGSVRVVAYASWTLGLVAPPGNPLGLRGVEDLGRPGLRMANREPGSGARAALDRWLERLGVEPSRLQGYAAELRSHLAAAQAVAAGLCDTAVVSSPAAAALRLPFVPVQPEPCLAVVRRDAMDHPGVSALLEVLHSGPFRRELAGVGGYDLPGSGAVVAEL